MINGFSKPTTPPKMPASPVQAQPSFMKILSPQIERSLMYMALTKARFLICISNSIYELGFHFFFFHKYNNNIRIHDRGIFFYNEEKYTHIISGLPNYHIIALVTLWWASVTAWTFSCLQQGFTQDPEELFISSGSVNWKSYRLIKVMRRIMIRVRSYRHQEGKILPFNLEMELFLF